MFGFGRLLGSIFEGASYMASAVVENPKNAAYVVGAVALLAGAASVGYVVGREVNQTQGSTTPLARGEYPKSFADLLEPSAPSGALFAPPPDTNVVDTVKIRVPKYIVRRDTVTKTRIGRISLNAADYDLPSLSLETSLQSSPYKFLVLPTVDGRPAVNVNSKRTLINTFDPRDASSIKLRYSHPKDVFDFGPYVTGRYNYGGSINSQFETGIYGKFRKSLRIDIGINTVPRLKRVSPFVGVEISHDITQYF